MRTVQGFAGTGGEAKVRPWSFQRRDLRPDDVAVRVTHCGICHTDLHSLTAHTGPEPLVPGHEFVGEVSEVGAAVSRFAVGDRVAVGNIVDSCGVCPMCRVGQENFCDEFPTLTYGGTDRVDGRPTQGAYATEYVVSERFTYRLPDGLDPAAAAPLLCAGITVWEPLRRWGAGPGVEVAVVGLGGLGHLAVKLAHALGARVTVFTTSATKVGSARALGADDVVLSTDPEAMAVVRNRFALVLDTVSAPHDLTPFLHTVGLDGTLCNLGVIDQTEFEPLALLVGRKSLASAGSGGRRQTQEMLDFCAEHGIGAEVEVVGPEQLDEALGRLERNDVRYRFVLQLPSAEPAGG